MQGLLQHWTKLSIIPNSKERSVWRNKKSDRFLRGRQIAHLIYDYFRVTGPMILSRIVPTCLLLLFEMMIFRNSIRNGTEIYYQWRKSHLMTSWKGLYKLRNTRVWETQDRIGIVWLWDSSEESRTSLSQIEDNGEKKYRAEFTNQEFWGQKRKFWKKRRGQESGDKTAWTKNSRRLLARGVQRAVF